MHFCVLFIWYKARKGGEGLRRVTAVGGRVQTEVKLEGIKAVVKLETAWP
ncbi:MAG: hypothetical protein ACKESB_01815 [Candidatus Hodgkinia cicadicola]